MVARLPHFYTVLGWRIRMLCAEISPITQCQAPRSTQRISIWHNYQLHPCNPVDGYINMLFSCKVKRQMKNASMLSSKSFLFYSTIIDKKNINNKRALRRTLSLWLFLEIQSPLQCFCPPHTLLFRTSLLSHGTNGTDPQAQLSKRLNALNARENGAPHKIALADTSPDR